MSGSGKNGLPSISLKNKDFSLTTKDRDAATVKKGQKVVNRLMGERYSTPPPTQRAYNDTQFASSAPPSSRLPLDGTNEFAYTSGQRCMTAEDLVGPSSYASLHLSPAESLVAAQKGAVAERWKSNLLEYETDLRELVTQGGNKAPTVTNIVKTVRIYDAFCRVAEDESPYFAEMLRLFRIEFCRAIFSNQHIEVTSHGTVKSQTQNQNTEINTYFEQVETLLRENSLLSTEIVSGNTKDRLVELLREVDKQKEALKMYENDIERLTRQNDHLNDQCKQMRQELKNTKAEHEVKVSGLEKEIQNLAVENKDMQLQLFRLRKQVSGGKAKILKDSYRQMKKTKMAMMSTLFSEGDERVSLLVLHSQIESRLNEILDTYDNEYVLINEYARKELQDKMASTVLVLLEEIHLCEQNYRRLVRGEMKQIAATTASSPKNDSEEIDETDGFVAIMFNEKIYENVMSRQVLREKLQIAEKLNSPDAQVFSAEPLEENMLPPPVEKQRMMSLNSTPDFSRAVPKALPQKEGTNPASVDLSPKNIQSQKVRIDQIMEEKRREWIRNITGTDEKEKCLTVAERELYIKLYSDSHIPSDELLKRILKNPMQDLSSDKFMAGVDLWSGRDPAQQKLLCSVRHIDPSEAIHLPENTNFVKLKYKSCIPGKPVLDERPSSSVRNNNSELLSKILSASHPNVGGTTGSTAPTAGKKGDSSKPKISEQLQEWGGETVYTAEKQLEDEKEQEIFNVKENLRVFKELGQIRSEENKNSNQKAGGVSSNTATTVAFQRLDPMSPNRAPEWTLYQNLFSSYRTLTPRMIEITTIDHILLRACERHFTRLEYRYDLCYQEANTRATNHQMCLTLAERYFREAYLLTDFQESIVDELEERYKYPELVAKTYYELLCYMDAMAPTDPTISLYLSVIRGFFPPTYIHFICFMLFNLSYSWPSANPLEEVAREDAMTVLRYLYRNSDTVVHVDIIEIMKDFEMATRSATLTFLSMRQFLANSILHMEEALVLYLHGLFRNFCDVENIEEVPYEVYSDVLARNWQTKLEKKSFIRFLMTGLGFNKNPLLSIKDLVWVASSSWASSLWM